MFFVQRVKKRPIHFIRVDYDRRLPGDLDNYLQGLSGNDRSCWILGVARNIDVRYQYDRRDDTAYLMMMSLVFGLMRSFNSSISTFHPSASLDFHRLTSAPRLSGTE